MSAEDFHLIDNEKIGKANKKRNFLKVYYQHDAQIDDEKKYFVIW